MTYLKYGHARYVFCCKAVWLLQQQVFPFYDLKQVWKQWVCGKKVSFPLYEIYTTLQNATKNFN